MSFRALLESACPRRRQGERKAVKMKNRIVVLSVAALALSACTESVTAPYADPGDALLASNGPAAIFDLTTPTLSGGASGSSVTLNWTPTNLQAVCDAAATANTLNEATTC